MESIVFLERSTFNIEFRRPAFLHDWTDYEETLQSEIVSRLCNATIAICNKLEMTKPAVRNGYSLSI